MPTARPRNYYIALVCIRISLKKHKYHLASNRFGESALNNKSATAKEKKKTTTSLSMRACRKGGGSEKKKRKATAGRWSLDIA